MWEIEAKQLELRYIWKISRNSSEYKTNLFVRYSEGAYSVLGEVAPNIRYNETPELVQKQFAYFAAKANENFIPNLSALTVILNDCELCHALRFGIESAFIHYVSKNENKSVAELLQIRPPDLPVKTTYSLPIMPIGEIKEFLKDNRTGRFESLKVKVNKEEGVEIIKEISRHSIQPLMIDGNECWSEVDEAIYFMEKLKNFRIIFIEQPMPASLEEEYCYLKKHSKYDLIADESCTLNPDFDKLSKQFHGINMKLMKAGGYLNGLRILNEARKRRMKTMIGCMVETSIGIASAMNLCHNIDFIDLDGFLILKDEPFGLVKEEKGGLTFA